MDVIRLNPMTHTLPGRQPVGAAAVPDNLGPTLLIAVGAFSLPLGIGLPLLLLGLARIRTREVTLALPQLSGGLRRFRDRFRRFRRGLRWVD